MDVRILTLIGVYADGAKIFECNLTFFTIGTLLSAGLEAKIILLLIVIPISILPKGGTPTS